MPVDFGIINDSEFKNKLATGAGAIFDIVAGTLERR